MMAQWQVLELPLPRALHDDITGVPAGHDQHVEDAATYRPRDRPLRHALAHASTLGAMGWHVIPHQSASRHVLDAISRLCADVSAVS